MTLGAAPGKIILFGEHAVVYGRPALAAPVTQVQAQVEVSDSPRAGIWIEAPEIGVHAEMGELPPAHPLAAAVAGTLQALDPPLALPPLLRNGGSRRGVDIRIASTIPVASGLGSGAAVSVALIRALSAHLGRPLEDHDLRQCRPTPSAELA